MIKLIITDMDGTLLDEYGKMPSGALELVKEVHDRGYAFCVASGRNFPGLSERFKGLVEDMYFITDNGSNVFRGSELVISHPMSKEDMQFVMDYADTIPGAVPFYNGVKNIYVPRLKDESQMDRVNHEFLYYFKEYLFVEDLDEILARDSVTRAGIFTEECVYDGLYQKAKKDIPQYNISASAEFCIDIMGLGVNKGLCIKELQELLGITVEETMIFGDNYNDICMMDRAAYSYAMENGQEELKNICNYIAPPNTEAGVLQVIRKEVLKEG